MQRKVYFLSTCDTCKRIMKEVGVDDSFERQDTKFDPVTEQQVEGFYRHTGSYEALINKRARKLKNALDENPVSSDADYKKLLLMDYTFLKRPVFEINNRLFVGNAPKVVEAVKKALGSLIHIQ
ncbi:MAG TPA: ArsC/Spx/MgsR family protein [Sunxiuqinia sp.]|nr:ArsC/Spx/MgsR family protein [Sunxiuqinia sp.]